MAELGDRLRVAAVDADNLANDNTRLGAELAAANTRIAELEAQQPQPEPTPGSYTVKSGDTLFSISQATGVSVDNLKAWNGLTSDTITVGQVLRLTAPEPGPDPPPEPVPTSKIVLGHVALHGSGTWRQKADAVVAKFGKFQGHLRVYWGPGTSGILSAELKAWLDASPDNKLFANWKPWSTNWAQVTSGARDSIIIAAAKSWTPYVARGQFILTFGHEPENDGEPLADFVPMWRRAAGLMRANAPGIKLVWTMMGAFSGAGRTTSYYQQLWPGAEHVDILGHDPYIVKGTVATKLPTNMINGALGLRALPGAANLPVIAAEWGPDLGGATTDRGTDQHRADAIDAVTARLADLAACGHIELDYYDDGSDYLSASGPDVAAYKRLKAATEQL